MSPGVIVDLAVFSTLSLLALVAVIAVARNIRNWDRLAEQARQPAKADARISDRAWRDFLTAAGLADREVPSDEI